MIWRKYGRREFLLGRNECRPELVHYCETPEIWFTHRGMWSTTLCKSSKPQPSFALLGTSLCCTIPSTGICWPASTISTASRERNARNSETSPAMEHLTAQIHGVRRKGRRVR